MNEKLLSAASSFLKEAENRVSADFRYLAYPLGLLSPTVVDGGSIYTDGKTLSAGAEKLCETVAADGIKGAERAVLHVLLHVLQSFPPVWQNPAHRSESSRRSDARHKPCAL